MRILLTGSSGWLGESLAPRLVALGHEVIGLDPVPSERTAIVGSVADRALVRQAIGDHKVQAVIHSGAVHQPDMARHGRQTFIDVNVTGTLNLLEEAADQGVERFVFTSTTSLMITQAIREGARGGAREAVWLTEAALCEPRNIYGATKLAAESLCRVVNLQTGLPVVVLRTSRFFPEADDMAHAIEQSDANTKANELLYRRLTQADAAEAHVAALDKAPELGFDIFIISARPPFSPDDAEDLIRDAPAVVERYFPGYREIYNRLGWTMFASIDRVYDPSRAAERLGFVCKTGFGELLAELKARQD
ncbi:NAD-dependent epimerase/dehydratase family protein [Phenylobacterium montanum]|uniref:NAD(P)-dependent oxidoreductase n=1 Tax=Phenylobacterium montanum TaxID=2823693 RepID=A0A975FX33_9CAUL|nr:NAD(P)-dependent oxidoreductase [Caulobacter sp. S6]QUD86408.1 NAD(P)-dependent oxidoreductase [Caulobacter sp. S6]